MDPTIKPFQATYYNPELIKDFSLVVCPPYDVIDSKKAAVLRKKSPYNYCRISLAVNKDYSKPATNLKGWRKQKVLIDDQQQNYYLYQRKFKVEQKEFTCYGIFCLLNMKKKEIFPHEHTLAKPKEDRRKMIASVKANLSPVYVIAESNKDFLSLLVKKYLKKKPFFKFKDDQGTLNVLWRVGSPEDIKLTTSALEKSSLVIADGHHRFETSFDYYQKNKGKFKDIDYIFSYVTLNQPGLLILPTHRVITSSQDNKINISRLKDEFNISLMSQKKLESKLKLARNFCFGLYVNKKFYFGNLKNKDILDTIKPSVYKGLDSYIFHKLVLPKIDYRKIDYSHSIKEIKNHTQKNRMVFLLRPATLGSVFDVAKAGYKLPQKSTYFYPKILSGLLMRRLMK